MNPTGERRHPAGFDSALNGTFQPIISRLEAGAPRQQQTYGTRKESTGSQTTALDLSCL